MPDVPPGWDADRRRRYLDALLAFAAAPDRATYNQLLAVAPSTDTKALEFFDGLAERPASPWVAAITEIRDALDGPLPPDNPSVGYENLRLLRDDEVRRAWSAYRSSPSDANRARLLSAAGVEAGRWLAEFSDALHTFPAARWHEAVTDVLPKGAEPVALDPPASEATSRLRRRGTPSRRNRPRLVWAAGIAAVAAALVVGALVVGHLPPAHRSTPPSTLLAAWTLAGDIDQPTWHITASGGASSTYLSCSTTTDCFASVTSGSGTSVVESTSDGGASWIGHALPAGIRLTAPLACPNSGMCVGAGIGPGPTGVLHVLAVLTSDGGYHWTEQLLPTGVGRVVALSCPSTSTCIGAAFVGAPSLSGATSTEQAVVVATTDAGASWSTHDLPSSFYPSERGLACASLRVCVLGGTEPADAAGRAVPTTAAAFYTDDGGNRWTAALLPRGLGSVEAVSCTHGGNCLAVAERDPGMTPHHYAVLRSSTTGQRSWRAVAGTGMSLAFVSGISCPTTNDCWASGRSAANTGHASLGSIVATDDGGTSWTDADLPSHLTASQARTLGTTSLHLTTVSTMTCPNPQVCVALGSAAFATPAAARVVLRNDNA